MSQIWSIGLAFGDSPLTLRVSDIPIMTMDDITDMKAGFVADPFLIHQDKTWHLFFEVWNCLADKGEIGYAKSLDKVNWIYQGIVLREPWHISYPHVFEYGGDLWMVPETIEASEVRLYRAESFPWRWRCVGSIVAKSLADPTPFAWQGRWYLFACSNFNSHDDLVVYTSKCLDGGWQEHPASPIRSGDARRSRPAGRMLVHGNRPLRWAQDCHPQYGTAVRAFEIVTLSPTQYHEMELPQSPLLGPGESEWRHDGMHHVDACWTPESDGADWMAAVDGFRL